MEEIEDGEMGDRVKAIQHSDVLLKHWGIIGTKRLLERQRNNSDYTASFN